jgi:hemoglobin
MRMKIAVAAFSVLFSILAGCATSPPPPPTLGQPGAAAPAPTSLASQPDAAAPAAASAAAPSLYLRLGGTPAITAVIDDFLVRLIRDGRINGRFARSDIPHLRALLIEQICEASGGPCKYTGKDMVTSHLGMHIAGWEFDALVQDLKASLDQLKVPAREQADLLAVLGPMKPDIAQADRPVGAPAAPGPAAASAAIGGGAPAAAAGPEPVLERVLAVRAAGGLLE